MPARQAVYDHQSASTLTPREEEVLCVMAMGNSNKAIARQLDLSPYTVSGYVKTIFRKLGVNNRVEATLAAVRTGVVGVADIN